MDNEGKHEVGPGGSIECTRCGRIVELHKGTIGEIVVAAYNDKAKTLYFIGPCCLADFERFMAEDKNRSEEV